MMRLEKLGPYRIEQELGRGGMGAVYAGVNEETGERAAIKVLAPAFASEPNFRGRFATEIETLKKLRHPNIVQLYGFGEEHGSLFYAMQMVEGDNLENEVRKGRHFDWREVIAIALDVCKALKHAHDRGVIHRDLKPANLLRGTDGNILLADFGIAKLFGGTEFTAVGGIVGTADFMSPEQAAGDAVTPRSDLYSLGASMFFLLAGRSPFQGRTLPDIIHQVRYTEAPLIGRFAPATPVELEAIIAKLLEKDPKKRLPTAIALSNLLSAMLNVGPQTVLDAAASSGASDDSAFVLSGETTADGGAAFDPSLTNRPTAVLPGHPAAELSPGVETMAPPSSPPLDASETPESLPRPTSRFTAVPEEELGRLDDAVRDEEDSGYGWLKLVGGAFLLAAVVFLVWRASRPPSADQLWERIQGQVEAEDVTAAAADLDSFLARFPDDPRRSEIEEYQQEVEVARLERIMERRVRAMQVGEPLPLIESTYLDAMRTARTAPHRAVQRLESLLAVFGTQPNLSRAEQACLDLARKQLARLQQTLQETGIEHRTSLDERLKAAESLHESDPAAAMAIWRGIAELYGDQPWAADAVAEANRRLAETGG